MTAAWQGTVLDGEAVLLDPARARLVRLDAWTLRLWDHCDGRTTTETARALGVSVWRAARALRALAKTGAVTEAGGRWHRTPLRWV